MDGACSDVFKKNKDPSIIHMGSFPNGQLPKVYSTGDIFLSVRQGCSCSNVIGEAQAAGLCVISPSWGGDAEMLVDKKSGMVVDGGHWDYNQKYISNITDAIETIIPNITEYKQNARKNAVDNLSIDTMIKKYLSAMKLGK
jgi:glycosyltransferase involved in cell wall biosynthesis